MFFYLLRPESTRNEFLREFIIKIAMFAAILQKAQAHRAHRSFGPETIAGTHIAKRWPGSVLARVMLATLYVLGKAVTAHTLRTRRRCWQFRFHSSGIHRCSYW
jgi:hypothetical protein